MIVAAERQELSPLSRRLTGAQPLDLGVSWSLAGRLGSLPVVLATNRPGRRNAAAAVHRVAARLSLRGIVSTGWCGGLDPTLRVAQIVVADRVVSLATAGNGANQPLADARRSVLSTVGIEPRRPLGTSGSGGDDPCPGLLDPAAEFPARVPVGPAAARGPVLTVDHFVRTPEEKRRLHATGAIAVEMEAAAVAAEARRLDLPFFCIRAVSDSASASFTLGFSGARLADGRYSPARIVALAGLSPARWGELLLLWRSARAAAQALGDYLGACEFDC